MKKTLIAIITFVTALAVTSCQNEEDFAQQPTNKPMVINAVAEGIGTGVRATMAYKYDILWSENDQIYVRNIADNTKNALFDLKTGEGTTEGTFEHASGSTFAQGEEVESFYPASLIKDGNLLWPAEQTTSTVVPMYSKQTLGGTGTEDFSFASLGAVLQIVFTTPQADVTLKSITIKDDDATMSGTFTVDESGKANITATDKAGITLNLGEGVAVSNKIQYFNIAVPAGTYSKLSITFKAADKSTCTFTGSNVTINHNTVSRLTLTGKEFKKFGQGKAEVNASAGIPDNKVKWVQLWKDGPKFAEFNVGATSVAEYGDLYAWGGINDKDITDYNTGTANLSCTGDNITDTATRLWGKNWRMPTQAELQALIDSCDGGSTTVNGLKGHIFTGKGDYSSNSVFLPAAGLYDDWNGLDQKDEAGFYWSSTFGTSYSINYPYSLIFNWKYLDLFTNDDYKPDNCFSVRAVLNEAE